MEKDARSMKPLYDGVNLGQAYNMLNRVGAQMARQLGIPYAEMPAWEDDSAMLSADQAMAATYAIAHHLNLREIDQAAEPELEARRDEGVTMAEFKKLLEGIVGDLTGRI